MIIFITIIILLIAWLTLYITLYPRIGYIYKDDYQNLVRITNVNGFVVTLVYILDDGQEVTSPQNWDLIEFIKTFSLWKTY